MSTFVLVSMFPMFLLGTALGRKAKTRDVWWRILGDIIIIRIWLNVAKLGCLFLVRKHSQILYEPWFFTVAVFVVGLPVVLMVGVILGRFMGWRKTRLVREYE